MIFGQNEHNSVTGEENKSQNSHVKSNFNNNKNCFRLLQLWFTFDFMHTKKHNGLACPKSRTLFQYCLLKYSVICVSWTKSHKAIEVADIAPCAGKSRVRIAKSWRHCALLAATAKLRYSYDSLTVMSHYVKTRRHPGNRQ